MDSNGLISSPAFWACVGAAIGTFSASITAIITLALTNKNNERQKLFDLTLKATEAEYEHAKWVAEKNGGQHYISPFFVMFYHQHLAIKQLMDSKNLTSAELIRRLSEADNVSNDIDDWIAEKSINDKAKYDQLVQRMHDKGVM